MYQKCSCVVRMKRWWTQLSIDHFSSPRCCILRSLSHFQGQNSLLFLPGQYTLHLSFVVHEIVESFCWYCMIYPHTPCLLKIRVYCTTHILHMNATCSRIADKLNFHTSISQFSFLSPIPCFK